MPSTEHADVVDTSGDSAPSLALGNAPIANLQSGTSRRCELQAKLNELSSRYPMSRVYIVLCRETGLRKIGVTKDLKARMAQLSAGSAYPLEVEMAFFCPDGSERIFESILHSLFADRRTHGEWFKLTMEDLFFIAHSNPLSLRLDRESHFREPEMINTQLCRPDLLESFCAHMERIA